jgi:hypothetical protein
MAAVMAWIVCMAAVASSPGGSGTPPADPKQALLAALADARSSERTRHDRLLERLQTRSFLETLDSPADYAQASRLRLHVGQVVDALAHNPAPGAQHAFLTLTTNSVFLANDERVIALVLASVKVRPAPPALVAFWNRRSRPNGGFTATTITALVDNGSEPALALLEEKMVDPAHGDDDKVSWMRTDILRHRNDLPLLQVCERLLKGTKLRKNLRPLLVEALFDYRPGEWFKPASSYSAPRLESASPEALAQLRRIADLALETVALSPTQQAAVTLRAQQIEKLGEQGRQGPG